MTAPNQDPNSAPAQFTPALDDVSPVRTAAQWLVAAAGAVGAALIAGLGLGNVGKLADTPLLLGAALIAFLTAMVIVSITIRRASHVLVISRTTISDLLREEFRRRAQARPGGQIEVTEPLDPDMPWLLDQISENREWLLPDHASTGDLYAAYDEARRRAGPTPAMASPGSAEVAELYRKLTTVCNFARSELTRRAYQRLSHTITGWPGGIFTAAVVAFAVAVSWPVSKPPAVTTTYRLDVLLTGTPAALRKAGVPAGCRAGTRLTGVALDGDLAEPVVVTEPGPPEGAGPGRCPAARFTVTRDVGIPIPYVNAK
jgi:hypothetical protein